MTKLELAELLQLDINDLEGVFKYEEYGLTKDEVKLQANAVLINLKDHIEELIKG